MSFPEFPKKETIFTRDEAINSILTSIALEEMALSHIINAEGEKIQYAVSHMDKDCCTNIEMFLAVNDSVSSMIEQVTDLQFILKSKLKLATEIIQNDKPRPKPCPPIPAKCVAEFLAINKNCWQSESMISLENITQCKTDITLTRKDCNYYIAIPHEGKYLIKLELELIDNKQRPVVIEIALHDISMATVYSRQIISSERKPHVNLSDSHIWEVPASEEEHFLSVRLLSENSVNITHGKISILKM